MATKKAAKKVAAAHVVSAESALAIAQEYNNLRAARLALSRQVDTMEVEEKAKKKLLMDMLVALKINSVGDTERVYAIITQDEPTVEDMGKLYKHIQKTGEFDLLYKRVNNAAVKERWELGKAVPGVGKFPVQTLSVTQAKS